MPDTVAHKLKNHSYTEVEVEMRQSYSNQPEIEYKT